MVEISKFFNGSNKLNTDSTNYQKPTFATEVGAGLAGTITGAAVTKIIKLPCSSIARNAFNHVSENYSYKQPVIDVFNKEIKEKGVKLVEAQKIPYSEIDGYAEKLLPNLLKKAPKSVQKGFINEKSAMISTIKSGNNGMFTPETNEIYLNTEKLIGVGFHEMGHAKNFNNMGIGKVLAKTRGVGLLSAIAAFYISAFKPKKAPNEAIGNPVDRVTTYVKEHPATTTFACFAPMLLEEGLASIKGAKMAKPVLSNRAFKNLNKMHAKAWSTYLLFAAAYATGAKVASVVHDDIASPNRMKK